MKECWKMENFNNLEADVAKVWYDKLGIQQGEIGMLLICSEAAIKKYLGKSHVCTIKMIGDSPVIHPWDTVAST